ncbi:MAG: Lrp/AsnC family transcriptional regulator [Nitrosarchaeum sp.]|nr:Lrp/AsnC family transcriptional regulator [Nitrosarchaeum sp.]
MLDKVDSEILRLLSNDATLSAQYISAKLKKKKISLTPRAIRKRITTLEKNKVITKFVPVIEDNACGKIIKRVILVQFQHSNNFLKRLEEYKQYLNEAPQCIFAVRIRGDLDWIHYKCFPNKEIADIEDDVFRQSFGDIIKDYHSYDAEIMKDNFNGCIDKREIQKHLLKYSENTLIG